MLVLYLLMFPILHKTLSIITGYFSNHESNNDSTQLEKKNLSFNQSKYQLNARFLNITFSLHPVFIHRLLLLKSENYNMSKWIKGAKFIQFYHFYRPTISASILPFETENIRHISLKDLYNDNTVFVFINQSYYKSENW